MGWRRVNRKIRTLHSHKHLLFELSEKKILSFSVFFSFFFTAVNPQPYPTLPPFRSSVRPSFHHPSFHPLQFYGLFNYHLPWFCSPSFCLQCLFFYLRQMRNSYLILDEYVSKTFITFTFQYILIKLLHRSANLLDTEDGFQAN